MNLFLSKLVLSLLCLLSLFNLSSGFLVQLPSSHNAALKPRTSCSAKSPYKSFDELIQGEPAVLVDFYAVWCGPCKMMAPELSVLGGKLKGDVTVAKLDTERFPKTASRYMVDSLPTLVLFKDGKEIHRFKGFQTAGQLEPQIRYLLAGSPVDK
ncbi:unnamed protein product [Chrysoparadoxa australica]